MMKTKKRLLVIEENPDIRDILCFILSDEGYEVTAITPDLSHPEKYRPDLIILDERLKQDTENLLCIKLKNNPFIKNIPVILFSTDVKIEKLAEVCKSDDYLPKPFDVEDLLTKINQAFGGLKQPDSKG